MMRSHFLQAKPELPDALPLRQADDDLWSQSDHRPQSELSSCEYNSNSGVLLPRTLH